MKLFITYEIKSELPLIENVSERLLDDGSHQACNTVLFSFCMLKLLQYEEWSRILINNTSVINTICL